MLDLRFPKFIVVANPQLTMLYRVIFTLVLVAQVFRFVLVMQWTEKMPVAVDLNVGIDQESIVASYSTKESAEFCTGMFEFNRAGVHFVARENRCTPMCTWEQRAAADVCIHPLQTYLQNGAAEITVVTAHQEFTTGQPVASPGSSDIEVGCSWRYFLSVEPLAVRLSYSWMVVEQPRFSFSGNARMQGTDQHSNTVIGRPGVGDEFEPLLVILPGEDIRISIAQMSTLASLELHDDQADNAIAGLALADEIAMAALQGNGQLPISLQRFGAEIVAAASCYNTLADVIWLNTGVVDPEARADRSSPVCLLSFRIVSVPHAFNPVMAEVRARLATNESDDSTVGTEAEELDTLYSQRFGVKVRCEQGRGFFRFPNIEGAIVTLSSIFVFLALPRWIVLKFCEHGIGHLSSIYRRVINEHFSITGCCGPLASRLMAYSLPFEDMADCTIDAVADLQGISKSMMVERLTEVLKSRKAQLDDAEVGNFVRFCFDQIVARSTLRPEVRGETIDLDAFSLACTSNDQVDVESIVKLFDRDRSPHLLERTFTPRGVKVALFRQPSHHEGRAAGKHPPARKDDNFNVESAGPPAQPEDSIGLDARTNGRLEIVEKQIPDLQVPRTSFGAPAQSSSEDEANGRMADEGQSKLTLKQQKRTHREAVAKNDSARKHLRDVTTHVVHLHGQYSTLSNTVNEVGAFSNQLSGRVNDLENKIATMQGTIHETASRLERQAKLAEDRAQSAETMVTQLKDSLAVLEARLSALAAASAASLTRSAETAQGAAEASPVPPVAPAPQGALAAAAPPTADQFLEPGGLASRVGALNVGQLPSDMATSQSSLESPRVTVTVLEEFMSNSKNPALLLVGMQGRVLGFDQDGDASIHFEGLTQLQWVFTSNFHNLKGLDVPKAQEHRPWERRPPGYKSPPLSYRSSAEEPAKLEADHADRIHGANPRFLCLSPRSTGPSPREVCLKI